MSKETPVSTSPYHLRGALVVPRNATGIVLFAQGHGTHRQGARNEFVTRMLNSARLGTLLLDLATPEEEVQSRHAVQAGPSLSELAERLWLATEWVKSEGTLRELPVGYFGSSTDAAAALIAAVEHPEAISAVVCSGGRLDLLEAGTLLAVRAPTLFVVGGNDPEVLQWTEEAHQQMDCEAKVEIVPRAGHRFEEPGALACVGTLAAAWFAAQLSPNARRRERLSSTSEWRPGNPLLAEP